MKRFVAFYSKSKCIYPKQEDFIKDFENSTEAIAEVVRTHSKFNSEDPLWKTKSGFVYDRAKRILLTKEEVVWIESMPPEILFKME